VAFQCVKKYVFLPEYHYEEQSGAAICNS